MSNLEIALSYAKKGIKVFPCNEAKAPAVKGGKGFVDATVCEEQIKQWWSQFPDAMIGSPNDEFLVLDSDDHNLDDIGRWVHTDTLKRLKEYEILTDDVMTVKTKSGGTHFYFKKNQKISRKIRCLPYFDLLGNGGYTILPDQKNYIAQNTNTPWDMIDKLPPLKEKEFFYLVTDLEPVVSHLKESARIAKSGTKIVAGQKPRKVIQPEMTIEELPDRHLAKLYTPTQAKQKIDPTKSLLVDGIIPVYNGFFSSETINTIFYNKEIQTILGKFIGLKLQPKKDRITQRSIFTHHLDKKPSMGVRWSIDKNYLIVRDFAMFFSEKQHESDYDLVRLYTSIKYEKPHNPSKSEFVLWLTRLLHESKLINVNIPEIPDNIELSKNERLVLEALYTIDAYKKLHHMYDGSTVFSINFAKAWTGVNMGNALSKIKKSLAEKNLIKLNGMYDCSGGTRTDGFYKTDIISVIHKGQEEMNKPQKNAKDLMQKLTKNQTNTESRIEKKYPNLGTLYSLKLTEQSYQTVKNFCDDVGIENVPDREYMHVPFLVSDEFIADVVELPHTQYMIEELRLFIVEGDDGRDMLMCEGTGSSFEEMWGWLNEKHGSRRSDYMDVAIPAFVISNDIGEKELDLDMLEIRLNSYTAPAIMCSDLRTYYLPNDQIDDILDGIPPEI